jgi:hypothetical protein
MIILDFGCILPQTMAICPSGLLNFLGATRQKYKTDATKLMSTILRVFSAYIFMILCIKIRTALYFWP